MKLFLREHIGIIFLYILNFVVLFAIYSVFNGFSDLANTFYFIFLSLFLLVSYLILRYLNNRKIYTVLKTKPDDFNNVLGSFGTSEFGKNLNRFVNDLYGLYQYKVHSYIRKQNEHLNFINQWVHQMKTPLSVIKLILQENEDEPYISEIKEEADKLERGLNVALYNARLDTFEHDFNVTDLNLKEVVNEVINSLKRYFIKNQIYPKVYIDKSLIIKSDRKWIKFILEQLMINSVKYSLNKGKYVQVNAYRNNGSMILEVADEGVGIPKKDLKRVLEPFYTGENGRKFGESTGMRLYLVNQVCKKLNHDISIESEEGIGTKVKIVVKNFKLDNEVN
ncbi:sensor histidine kinase [Clostridium ganghwense]|uniref:histidine kinase n=1 Tax=Clostridium ganghwense TaxID=312089 RepID=A0ABT4CRM0_9CLOT|nr:sensor histidine kinase [Clostridium ganghwense]MCY6371710.1 sensor histidine kinase [Clostridium ganghwense]